MFRADKPLPPLPKGLSDKFAAFASSASNVAKSAAASAASHAKSRSPDRGGGSFNMAAAKALFEPKSSQSAANNSKNVGFVVDVLKKVPTNTLANAASSVNSNASKLPLTSMIDMAKSVDTKHYVAGAQYASTAANAYDSNQRSHATTTPSSQPVQPSANVSALRSQLETKLTFGSSSAGTSAPPRPTTEQYSNYKNTSDKAYSSSTPSYATHADNQNTHTSIHPTQPYAIATDKNKAESADEIDTIIGDTIYLLRTVDENWVYGRNARTNVSGIVPINFLNIKIPLKDKPISTTHRSLSSNLIANYEALYNFEAQSSDEMSIKAGDRLQMRTNLDDNWADCTNVATRQSGIVPISYIGPINAVSKQPDNTVISTMIAIADYNSDEPADLLFYANDEIEILQYIDENWVMARRKVDHTNQGMAPLTYLTALDQITSTNNKQESLLETPNSSAWSNVRVRALYDYKGQTNDDLWFSAGDEILVTHQIDDNWLCGKLQLGYGMKSMPPGIFPLNFVEKI